MSRVVLITGASSGYGKAMARAFKDNGDTVIMTARNFEKLEAVRVQIGGDLAIPMDVTKPDDWDEIVKTIKCKYGRLDILINNAGGGIAIKETSKFTTEEIDETIKLNEKYDNKKTIYVILESVSKCIDGDFEFEYN